MNGEQLSYFGLGTGIFKCRKWWIEPGFIAPNLSFEWQSHQILLYLQQCVNKTDTIGKIVKIGVQQSSLCHNLNIEQKQTNIKQRSTKKHLSNLTTTFIANLFMCFLKINS